MSIQELLKHVNISGFQIDPSAIKPGAISILVSQNKDFAINLDTKLSTIAANIPLGCPIV